MGQSRIGLVGANPDQSWAKLAHIPAIKALSGLDLVGVATSNASSAKAAAAAFAVEEYYASGEDLARSAHVDVVSVCVKVPYHRAIVLAACEARKHVICEWPLAIDVAEASELEAAAQRAGVRTAIGLQGRMSPAARRARALLRAGAIGTPLTARILATTEGHGPQLPSAYAYLCDKANGATMSTILTGHVLDLSIFLLGGIREIGALATIKWPDVKLSDAAGSVPRNTPDHLSVQALFDNGCVLSAVLDGGRLDNPPFVFEVMGDSGSLTLSGGHPYGYQAGELRLDASVPFDPPEPAVSPLLHGPRANVGELYAAFAKDVECGSHTAPDFSHAVRLHRLIAALGVAATTGSRQIADRWPTQ